MRPQPHPLLTSLAAVALISAGLAAVPAARAASEVPLLWAGAVQDADGEAAAADVVAFARPPARTIRSGDKMLPVARTVTDDRGRFSLSARPETLSSLADESGWITVMVMARSAEGRSGMSSMSMAVDSVAWEPGRSGRSGRWVSSPAARWAPVRAQNAEGAAEGAETAEDLAPERPAVLTLSGRPAPSVTPMFDQPKTKPKGKGACVARAVENIGVRPVVVGELHREHHWGGEFVYTNTKSTSYQVGYSATGGGDWKLAGSGSMSRAADEDSESGGPQPGLDHLVFETFQAEMEFGRFLWRCGEPDWEDVYTVEPIDWTGGVKPVLGGTPARCNVDKTASVGPRRYLRRGGRASETHERAFGILGFTGSTTTSVSTAVSFKWVNEWHETRYVCGDAEFPSYGNTRVVSLP